MKFLSIIILGLALNSNVLANEHAIILKAGTLGAGLEYLNVINDKVNMRFGVNYFKLDRDLEDTDVKFDGELTLKSLGLIGDYHPFGGVFRLSAGLFYNKNAFDIAAKTTSSASFTFDNTEYNAQQAGPVIGKVDFAKSAPYLGLGWGASPDGGGFAFSIDIGALRSTPNSTLQATNCQIPNSPDGTDLCAQLKDSIEIERVKLQKELNKIKWYPVISLGVSVKF